MDTQFEMSTSLNENKKFATKSRMNQKNQILSGRFCNPNFTDIAIQKLKPHGYVPPRSSQAAFAESHPTTREKLCDELRDGWLFCYHQHLPGLKIDPKMWSKWDGIENLTHLTRLEATWNGS